MIIYFFFDCYNLYIMLDDFMVDFFVREKVVFGEDVDFFVNFMFFVVLGIDVFLDFSVLFCIVFCFYIDVL